MKKPVLFVIALVIFFGLFFYFSNEYGAYLDLENLKKLRVEWSGYYQENPILSLSVFFFVNAFFAALPVAGITLISLLGGALFGLGSGILLSSTATAFGNLVGFFIARYFLQSYVREKYHTQYEDISARYDKYGAYVLFSLRVFPLIPSFIATVVMSLTKMKWSTFFLVSWIGRLPMVIVYSYAGFELSRIESLGEILSPQILISLFAMSFLPWLFRYLTKRE